MIDAQELTEEALDEIAYQFDSQEICDKTCFDIFVKNKWSLHKTVEWAKSDKLYVKRAAFVIMAALASEDKKAPNLVFQVFLPIMIRECTDEREAIKSAISWALIALGKRNNILYKKAIRTANEMLELEEKRAKEIATDVLKALEKKV